MANHHFLLVPTGVLVLVGLTNMGCATKKYVTKQTTPISARVEEVDKKHSAAVSQLDEKEQKDISRVDERASGAEGKANDAMSAAQKADSKAGEAAQIGRSASEAAQQAQTKVTELDANLKDVVKDMDRYTLQTSEEVHFGFNKASLTQDGKTRLDQIVSQAQAQPRRVIEVEGYTDRNGSAEYNLELSRRRADAVVRYLIAGGIPLRQIHMVGLGKYEPMRNQEMSQQAPAQGNAGEPSADRSTSEMKAPANGKLKAKDMRRVVVNLYSPVRSASASSGMVQSSGEASRAQMPR